MRRETERMVQETVVAFMNLSPFYQGYFFHPPLERWEGRHAKILAKAGVKPGVPDLICFRESGTFHGLALELKRSKAPPSSLRPEQKRWIRTLRFCGWHAQVAFGVDEALSVLKWYAEGAKGPIR